MAKAKKPVTDNSGGGDIDALAREGRDLYNKWLQCWQQNREWYLEDLKFTFVPGNQWPQAIAMERKNNNRPTLEINQLTQYVRQVTNDQRQNRPAIRVRPANGANATEELADLYSGIIRDIEYQSRAAAAYDTAFECAVVGGYGAYRFVTEYESNESFNLVLRIKRIANPLCVVIDPYYQEADASDITGAFVTEVIAKDEFLRKWPNARTVDFTADKEGSYKHWFTENGVVVADRYKVEVKKRRLVLLPDGKHVFEDTMPMPLPADAIKGPLALKWRWVEQKTVRIIKQSGCEVLEEGVWPSTDGLVPVVMVFGDEANIEGEKTLQGMIRRARDPQMMFNFWQTAGTERAALMPKAPYIGYRGQFKDPKWQSANDRNWPFLEAELVLADGKPVPLPQRQSLDVETAGLMQMAQSARFDLQSALGMYDASLGQKSNETSGRAIVAREKQGDTGQFHFVDNLSRAIAYGGRICVDVLPNITDTERKMRVVKEDQTEAFEVVNQMTAGGIKNNIKGGGKFDIVVTVGPSYATKRVEAVEAMTEFMRVYPQAASLIGDLYAMSMDWPGAKQIAERLKMMLPPMITMAEASKDPKMAAAMAPLQQQLQAMQQQMAQMGQAMQAITAENTALKADHQAKIMQAGAQVTKANTDQQTAVIKGKQDVEKGELELTKVFAGLLAQFMKLQQTQVQPVGQQAAGLAPVVGGIINAADEATGEDAAYHAQHPAPQAGGQGGALVPGPFAGP